MKNTIVLVTALTLQAGAQIITLPPGPVAPGSTFPVTIFNNLAFNLGFPCDLTLGLQHADGGMILYPSAGDCSFSFPPGTSITVQFTAPASGPGSNGSFVLDVYGAAVRLDVGAPSPSFPAIHGCPAGIFNRFGGHQSHSIWAHHWQVANTGVAPHTFGAGDQIRIFAPGGTVPLAVASLAGHTVPGQSAASGPLPVAGLAPGPYTVEMTWLDPATNATMSVRHGIQSDLSKIDVGLPGGHVIPSGGVLPISLAIGAFPPFTLPVYAFCIGIAPGSTPIPGAGAIPLVLDAAVSASLANGVGGLLVANVGVAVPYSFSVLYAGYYVAAGVGVTHPGPAFSGLTVRGAAFAFELTQGVFGVSQGEDLVIQ